MVDRLKDVLACLDDLGDIVWEPYRHGGAGRPPRNPMGILKALIVKRVRGIPSDRELYRRLWNESELGRICDVEECEKPYHSSQLTRFRQRIDPERLERLMENVVGRLRDVGVIKGEIIVCDAPFIRAYSKRDPKDDSRGYGDPDARVGRPGKTYRLGCARICLLNRLSCAELAGRVPLTYYSLSVLNCMLMRSLSMLG